MSKTRPAQMSPFLKRLSECDTREEVSQAIDERVEQLKEEALSNLEECSDE